MASDIADYANSIVGGEDYHSAQSSGFFEESSKSNIHGLGMASSSSVLMLEDQSQFSRDIDRWMNGEVETTTDTPPNAIVQRVHNVRVPTTEVPTQQVERIQRPPLVPQSSSFTNAVWYYVLAVVLPIFSFNNCMSWRYNPGLVVNTAELFVTSLSRVCTQAHARFQQLAQDRITRELFATVMDVMLVIYAIGFLVLSMYQASVSI